MSEEKHSKYEAKNSFFFNIDEWLLINYENFFFTTFRKIHCIQGKIGFSSLLTFVVQKVTN